MGSTAEGGRAGIGGIVGGRRAGLGAGLPAGAGFGGLRGGPGLGVLLQDPLEGRIAAVLFHGGLDRELIAGAQVGRIEAGVLAVEPRLIGALEDELAAVRDGEDDLMLVDLKEFAFEDEGLVAGAFAVDAELGKEGESENQQEREAHRAYRGDEGQGEAVTSS